MHFSVRRQTYHRNKGQSWVQSWVQNWAATRRTVRLYTTGGQTHAVNIIWAFGVDVRPFLLRSTYSARVWEASCRDWEWISTTFSLNENYDNVFKARINHIWSPITPVGMLPAEDAWAECCFSISISVLCGFSMRVETQINVERGKVLSSLALSFQKRQTDFSLVNNMMSLSPQR